ncbi:7418_t:CDS:2, partial [Funneliformis geosporum]
INEIDESELDNVLESIKKSIEQHDSNTVIFSENDPQWIKLMSTIQQLSDKEVSAASHLIETMRYSKDLNASQLLLPYIQKKAYNFIADSYYKYQLSNESLKDANYKLELENKRFDCQIKKLIRKTNSLEAQVGHLHNQKSQHISEIRSLIRKSSISDAAFKNKIKSLFMINKRSYSSNIVWLATSITQIEETSMRSSIECTKLIYEFLIVWNEKEQTPIVIMASLKDIPKCNSETVSNIVAQSIQEDELDTTKCILWVTDNTAYMASNKKGAVALFNKKTGTNALQIGCELHIMQIILNHFEQEVFGKLSNSTGFSQKLHSYNLLYLAWHLHDGYNSSDKDKPLNLNASIIKDLYDKLMGFYYNQYQLPSVLVGRLFELWLSNSILNIQIKCLVNFAEHFYEPLVQFIVGQDPNLRIIQNGKLEKLPFGRRTHEMPDKIYEWKDFLGNLKNNVEMFFADELSEAIEILSNDEFRELFNGLENGINKAYEYFEKWLDPWLHLPLVIYRLGGNSAHLFANSFHFMILKRDWNKTPTDLELIFAKDLENDINCGIGNTFGLQEMLL